MVEDMLVPEDLERMYDSNRGALCGVVSDRKRNLALNAPKQSEVYDNPFFVGGSVNPGGGTRMSRPENTPAPRPGPSGRPRHALERRT